MYSQFLWVTNFPMFKRVNENIELGRHVFTKPKLSLNKLKKLKKDELFNIPTHSYDLIFNGRELLSGSLRNNN